MSAFQELVGRELGPCRLEALIGAGGGGAVFKARHLALDREVAVKVLAPSLHADAAAESRFVREARTAAKFEDPRIASVYDVGVDGQYRYIVMQLVRGVTLHQLAGSRGGLPQADAHRVMREVLLGLMAAHKAGIVHRDVKPGNVMVDQAGAVKVLDFGIAGAQGAPAEGEDVVAGTFDYMAPEQAFAPSPDPRMDMYAWACTYFFALTGRAPFTGSPADILVQHRDNPAPDVRTLKREVTEPCAKLLLRCMEKFPENRPKNDDEVLAEMKRDGFLLALDASGSPFRILPAPVVERQGFTPPPAAVAAAAASDAFGGVPPPPPPVEGGLEISPVAWIIFLVLYGVFFGKPWFGAVEADWLAGGLCLGPASAVLALSEAGPWRRAGGATLFVLMALFFMKAAGSPASAAAEVIVLAFLALATAGAGAFLAFWDATPDKRSGAGLILLGCAALACAASAQRLPETQAWSTGVPAYLTAQLTDWRATGGLWRWGGFLALYAASWSVRLSGAGGSANWARKKAADGRVLNWNK